MPNGFASNWAYLKTELNWLERVLMVAVSRHRQEQKGINRIAQSQADRVSAHWWKGLISLEGKAAYDEHRPPSSSQSGGYQQRLQARIQASHQSGVVLLLPLLCDRLQLTSFEKNLILMALAPEVNRRYGKLYQYLQGNTDAELPTLELVLRLLCRNDSDWQVARSRLGERWSKTGPEGASPLLKRHLIQLIRPSGGTFLSASVRVLPRLIDLLLSDASACELDDLLRDSGGGPTPIQPTPLLPVQFSAPSAKRSAPDPADVTGSPVGLSTGRTSGLLPAQSAAPRDGVIAPRPVTWDDLILPSDLIAELKHLSHGLTAPKTVDRDWGFEQQHFGAVRPGAVAALTGDAGTGRTLAARAIATAVGSPLAVYDLQAISPARWSAIQEEIIANCPAVVLIKSAQRWFAPQQPFDVSELMGQRRQRPALTLLSVRRPESLSPQWRRPATVLAFPRPRERDRLLLWKRAFPQQAPLGRLRWACLATLPLTGGEIVALAREAAILAVSESSERIMQRHVSAALRRQGHRLPPKGRS